MRRTVLFMILMGMFACQQLTACTKDLKPPPDPPDPAEDISQSPEHSVEKHDAVKIVNLEGADLIEPIWDQQDHEAAIAARGANEFAFRLTAALLEDIGHENVVISPYSVWMPLAALVNATGEEFRPALLDALGASGLNPGDINWAASRMLYDLTNEKLRKNQDLPESPAESPIQIANAIFVDNNYTLRMEFAQLFMDFFRGEMMYVDFRSPDTVAAVNQWASDKTNGLIKKVVREFDPDTAAAIANAIYFSDNWTSQFNPSKTEQDIFYSPAGESTAYFMQLEKFDFSYFEDELTQAVSLGFSTGGGMSILLPKDGDATGLLSSMTSEYFERIQSDFIFARGKLSLPRFHIENNLDDLKGALTKLGVPLFDVVSAPLTGGLIEEEVPLWISEAVQVAMIEIDEEGATAAAVTIMVVPPGGLPPPETTFEMICNRPFVFILHGRTNDGGRQVLFTGVVNQP